MRGTHLAKCGLEASVLFLSLPHLMTVLGLLVLHAALQPTNLIERERERERDSHRHTMAAHTSSCSALSLEERLLILTFNCRSLS